MGHVDHGKTTLLDAIRETRVAEREAGGITQHIGAYLVPVGGDKSGKSIVFLDTPGHSAFTMMRARGAKVTDVVILVVAADDGVMPQTREAIDHAKAANVKIIVAVNKIDKPGANPETVKRQLTELGLMPEDWGGQTVFVEVSAKKQQNLDALLEMILLVTEIDDLKANPKRSAIGTVLETKLDRGRGPVATVLVQDGTHPRRRQRDRRPRGRQGPRAHRRPRPQPQVRPARPRRWNCSASSRCPRPGDSFQAVSDPAKARQIATFRQGQAKEKSLGAKGSRMTLESLQAQLAEGGAKELALIIKADVQGSAEVLADTLQKLSDEKTKIKIIHSGVGAINESDVLLASASNAIVIGFNVRPGSQRGRRRGAREGRHPPPHGHLPRDRRDQARHGGPARPDLQGRAHRRRHRPRDVQGAEDRHHRRLHRQRGRHHAARATRRRACCATTSSSGKASSPRSSASRTTCPRSRPAPSAASASRATTTSRSAT